jgi:hypothetical protein
VSLLATGGFSSALDDSHESKKRGSAKVHSDQGNVVLGFRVQGLELRVEGLGRPMF